MLPPRMTSMRGMSHLYTGTSTVTLDDSTLKVLLLQNFLSVYLFVNGYFGLRSGSM